MYYVHKMYATVSLIGAVVIEALVFIFLFYFKPPLC